MPEDTGMYDVIDLRFDSSSWTLSVSILHCTFQWPWRLPWLTSPSIQRIPNSPIPKHVSFSRSLSRELKTYKIDRKALSHVERRHLYEFKDTFHDLPGWVSERCQMWTRAGQILFCIEVFEERAERKCGRWIASLFEHSHWDHIKWVSFYV